MAVGAVRSKAFTLSAAVGSASVLLDRGYQTVYIQVPTMASGTNFDVSVSREGTTYYQLRKEAGNTLTVQAWTFSIASTAMANGAMVPVPGGFLGYKLQATDSNPAAAGGFYIVYFEA